MTKTINYIPTRISSCENNSIQITCTDATITTFRLVDARGKTVRVIDLRELNKSINIANLESGIRSCVNTSLFQKFHFFLLY